MKLGFADADLERRFQAERQVVGLTRARILMFLGILVVGALGLVDVALNRRSIPDFCAVSLMIRLLIVAPLWLAMIASTYAAGHARRADAVYALGSVLIAWALAMLIWSGAHFMPGRPQASNVSVNTLAVLMLSAFALPMRFPAVLAMTGLTFVGITGFFLAVPPPVARGDLNIVATMLAGVSGLVVVVCWYREAAERRAFVQREEVRELNAELTRLNAEKNEFMAIAAHDLRAPLASVRGLAGQMRAGNLAAPEQREQALAAIDELSGRMLALVSDYLGAHAAETGRLPVRMQPVDLTAAAREAVARQQPLAAAKGQRLRVEGTETAMASADPGLLAQVADNFVANALKFSPAGATVRLEVTADGGVARLAVCDEGPGIPQAEQAGLFRPFGRTSVRPTAGEASHGLGLAVTKRLAEMMGGRVGCESTPGAGSVFWIELARA